MITPLNGNTLNPIYESWDNFLTNHCRLKREFDGTKFYNSANCNYILFPNNELIANFGFWGNVIMNDVQEKGWEIVLQECKEQIADTKEILKELKQYFKGTNQNEC